MLRSRALTGGPPSVLSFSTSVFRINKFLGQESRAFFYDHNHFTQVTFPAREWRLYTQHLPQIALPEVDWPIKNLARQIIFTNAKDHPAPCKYTSAAVPDSGLAGFCAAKLTHYSTHLWCGRLRHSWFPFTMKVIDPKGACSELPELLAAVNEPVQQLLSLVRYRSSDLPAIQPRVPFHYGRDNAELAPLMAVAGKRYLGHADDLLRRGYHREADLCYSNLIAFLHGGQRWRGLDIKREGCEHSRQVIDFFKSGVLDCTINREVLWYVSHRRLLEKRRSVAMHFGRRVALLKHLGWIDRAEVAELERKAKAVWAFTIAQLERNRSIADFVPFHWQTMASPDEVLSAEEWAEVKSGKEGWYAECAEMVEKFALPWDQLSLDG